MSERAGKFSITYAASAPDVLFVETVPRSGRVVPELTDAQVAAALPVPGRRVWVRATAPEDDAVMHAVFGDTLNVSTPQEARELWRDG